MARIPTEPSRDALAPVAPEGLMSELGSAFGKRKWDPMWLAKALADPARPVFLMGSTPPREGTTAEQAQEICNKFVARSRCHATDGFIVYDIQAPDNQHAP